MFAVHILGNDSLKVTYYSAVEQCCKHNSQRDKVPLINNLDSYSSLLLLRNNCLNCAVLYCTHQADKSVLTLE